MKSLFDLILEAGLLKRTPRSGWSVLGIHPAESVADHSFRCALIGYVLARLEKADAERVLLMTLFGDLQEARITDLHKMAQRYIDGTAAEDKAFLEQIRGLPPVFRKELGGMHAEYRGQRTKESLIARDADILECLIQACEYAQHGYPQAARFTKKAPGFLKTKSAKKLWLRAKKGDIHAWWVRLSTFVR
ncbi:MAG: HD domain-containing protein [Deltaproteobacteria bacterium]